MFSRGPKAVDAAPGDEYAKFLQEAAAILGTSADDLEISKELQSGYGCDELEVIELIQIAEDLWGTSLVPNAFNVEDAQRATRKFRTLRDIVNEAQLEQPH